MPFQRIPRVSDLLPGAIKGLWTIGDVNAEHVEIGTRPPDGSPTANHSGIRLYAADGETVIIELGPTPTVAGSVVAGTVGSATTSGTATNLSGGGTAAGSTAITGALTVGNPTAAHVIVGADAHGADGVRLYAADGVTPLIDLSIAGTPTITGALIRTAATGQRVELDGNAADRVKLYSGQAAETSPGELRADVGTIHGHTSASTLMLSPDIGHGQAHVAITRDIFGAHGAVVDEATGDYADFTADPFLDPAGNPLPHWAGTTQRTFDAGRTTVTTDASGQFTVAHNLGVVPLAATGTLRGTPRRWVTVVGTGTTASQIQFQVNDATGVVASTAGINVDWITVG